MSTATNIANVERDGGRPASRPAPFAPTPRLLRTKEAAAYLSMSPWSLRQLVDRGELPFVSCGDNTSAWRFDIRDLDRFIEQHKIGAK